MIGAIHKIWVKSSVGSDAAIELHPTEYTYNPILNRNRQRTAGGQLNTYTVVNCYETFTFPIAFVGSADAYQLNQWWENNTSVHLTINDSVDDLGFHEFFRLDDETMGRLDQDYNPLFGEWTYQQYECKLRNNQIPLGNRVNSRLDFYSGALFFATV